MLNIPVILGSVRKERKSIYPARLINQKLIAAGHQSQIVDFLELPLPFIDSDEPSKLNKKYPYENVQKWSGIADAADAFVIVAPEYNHGIPGVLKNALDWLYPEYEHKAAGLVGVSNGPVGGARAIMQLRIVCVQLNMAVIRETVMFPKVQDVFDAQGKLLDESFNQKIESFIKSMEWWAEALKKAR